MNKKTVENLKDFYNNHKRAKKYTEYTSFESFLNECKQVQKAIKNNSLIIVAKNKEYSLFDVFYIINGRLSRLMPLTKSLQPYTIRKDSQYINVTAIWTSRPYEIIYNMGRMVWIDHASDSQNII